jgi:hypothetical protein
MTALSDNLRPVVAFDPTNVEHRRYYAEFVKTGTWGRCPVRFSIDDMSIDLPSMIARRLIDFYVAREFQSE